MQGDLIIGSCSVLSWKKDNNREIYYPDVESPALAAIWVTLKNISREPQGSVTRKKSCVFFSCCTEAEAVLSGARMKKSGGYQPLSGTSILPGAPTRSVKEISLAS